jgi:hypothetical protein
MEGKSNIAQSSPSHQDNPGTLDFPTLFASLLEEPSARLLRKIHPARAGRRVIHSQRTFSLTMY